MPVTCLCSRSGHAGRGEALEPPGRAARQRFDRALSLRADRSAVTGWRSPLAHDARRSRQCPAALRIAVFAICAHWATRGAFGSSANGRADAGSIVAMVHRRPARCKATRCVRPPSAPDGAADLTIQFTKAPTSLTFEDSNGHLILGRSRYQDPGRP